MGLRTLATGPSYDPPLSMKWDPCSKPDSFRSVGVLLFRVSMVPGRGKAQ